MAEKVTVEEINGTLALERMKHREKLLRTIKGGPHEMIPSLLLGVLAILAVWFHALETSASLILVFVAMFILAGARDRRFNALVELLDLDHFSLPQRNKEITSTTTPKDSKP